MKSRFVFAAFAVLALAGSAFATVLEDTGFDAGYTIGALNTQNGWSAGASDFLVTNNLSQSAPNSVMVDTAPISVAWGWKVFGTSPNFLNSGIVVTSCWVRYADTTPGDRTDNSAFGLEAWANDGFDRVGTLMLDARGGASIKAGFGDAAIYDSGISTPADTWHRLFMVCKPGATSQVAGWVNGTQVGTVLSNTTAAANNVSDVDMAAYAFGSYSASFGVTTGGGFNVGYFDGYRADHLPVGTVWGHVDLSDWSISPAGVAVAVEVIDGGGNTVETLNTTLDANGDYMVAPTSRGTYSIGVKASHWLRKVNGTFNLTDMGLFGINHTQMNGDVDGDNEVGPGDFGALSSAFGSVDGDSNWDAMADLDGDGEVGPSDFGILSANFGESGE